MNHWRVFRVSLLVGARDFRLFWNWRTWLFGWLSRILTGAASWVLVGRLLGDTARLNYLLVGNAAVAGVGTFAVAASAWERWDGTYALLVVAPRSMAPAMMGRMAVWILHWIGSSFATFVFLWLAFSWHPPMMGLLVAIPGVTLLALSTYALSLFLGACIGRVPALRNILINLLTSAILVLCGVLRSGFVLAAVGPSDRRGLADDSRPSLPSRAGFAGQPGWGVARDMGLEVLVGFGWLTLAVLTIDRMAEAGRADGSIHFS